MSRLVRLMSLGVLGMILVVGVGISGDTKKETTKKPGLPAGWKSLKLSKDQYAKVISIAVDYDKKIRELQDKIDSLKQERRAQQVKVLTDAQKAILLKGLTGESKDKAPAKDK